MMDIPLVAVVSDHTNNLTALRDDVARLAERLAKLEAIVVGETRPPAAAVEKVMRAYGSGVQRRYQNRDQAERVAWRIMKDWAEAQLAIIETHMVSVDQVFLPYMLVDGSTVYDLYLTQQLALGTGDG